jgi:Family of unknown function (DUF5329)
MRRRGFLLGCLCAGSAGVGALPPPAEQARIERLIRLIETHPSAQFLRNGKAYSPSEAGRFLRGKLAKMGEHVNTAQDFIDQIASSSSTSGQVYQIRLTGGRTVASGDFLSDELKRMDR